jgi:DNA-binding response OmpR family regulator
MLTARSEETDQLIGLELGADDYINKPFSPRALVARVRAVLRRVQGGLRQPEVIRSGELEIDLNGHRVSLAGEAIHLTPNEFKILAVLAKHAGQILSRSQLVEAIHSITYDGVDRSVDSHIKNLRRKLEADPANPIYILTAYGIGYQFVGQD